jgi:anti-sigma factor RsiW
METRPYITCRQLIAYIAAYLEHELNEVEASDFERHLERCVSCRAYLASYREMIVLAREVAVSDEYVDDVPEELVRTILARLATTPKGES